MNDAARTLTLTYGAEPESVSRARHAARDFAAALGASEEQVDAIRLAVSEAVTNAVLHAYRNRPGDVHLTAAVVSDELWILIADDGCGLEPRTDRPGLGLGLGLISQVSDHLTIVRRASGGTEVRMRFDLGHERRARSATCSGAAGPRNRTSRLRESRA
jgi:serine/threonine-protein kinase RsbW